MELLDEHNQKEFSGELTDPSMCKDPEGGCEDGAEDDGLAEPAEGVGPAEGPRVGVHNGQPYSRAESSKP